jgi:hypothetical protein
MNETDPLKILADLIRQEKCRNCGAPATAVDPLGPICCACAQEQRPIPMILTCPSCSYRHIDVGEFATKVHHTHACQHCGMIWRPAIVPTVGVQFLPGFKNE